MTARFASDPVLVRRSEATRSTWGDDESGRVHDRFYGVGPHICGVVYTMTAGSSFGASPRYMPVPLTREERCQYVVAGTFALHDPESGHIAVAARGEAITWRGDQFHFGHNVGSGEVMLLDFFTDQGRPDGITDAAWSSQKRPLRRALGGRYDLLTHWPEKKAAWEEEKRSGAPMTVRPEDALQIMQGENPPRLMTILSSTPGLTVGTFELHGTSTDVESHPGDEVIYCVDGELVVDLPDSEQRFVLSALDCLFIPAGVRHRYGCGPLSRMTRAVFGVAPLYR